MIRFTVFDRWGNQTGVLTDVIEAVHKDEVNGEDSLTLVLASCDLTKGDRIVWRDGFGTWHEHTVNDTKDVHGDGKMYTTAYCENSIAELYTDYIDDLRPYDTTATDALQKALSSSRWEMGTVSVTGKASANFYHESAREALTDIIEAWGGELSVTIRVEGTRVSHRLVNITARRGEDNGKRFEWTKDMESITREVSTDDVVTALYGYGKGLEAYDDEGNLTGGYERKLKFGDINGGLDYVADEAAKARWGLPDGKGGIKHTFGKVEFSDCEDMHELLALTKAELRKRCEPRVTYSADVVDLADAGFSSEDVRAGDTVQIIDRELGVRLPGRVLCVERYLYNEQATRITLGNVSRSITDVMASVRGSVRRMESHAALWDGAASISASYMDGILASLNNTMNQTGGYTYIEPGNGIITYDKPKDQNPTMAVQVKGAGIRIANSKTSDGDWNWRTFGTGDGFSADEINAGTLNAGLIKAGILQDESGKNYWNMKTGELRMAGYATGDDLKKASDAAVTRVDVLYAIGDSPTEAPSVWLTDPPAWQDGKYIWTKTRTTKGDATSDTKPLCITGAAGKTGEDGKSVTVASVSFAPGASGTVPPASGWQASVPVVGKGSWLWCRTAYSDGTTVETCSYIGTDGRDGKSVVVQSAVKSGKVTTVVLAGSDGKSTTLTIDDGQDGQDGVKGDPGDDGRSSYTHIAWADSADGSTGFSTSESTDKSYLGVYEDDEAADSGSPSDYSWSLIKGADGKDGATGNGVSSVTVTYGTSASATEMPTAWQNEVPQAGEGRCLWTRTVTDYTDPSKPDTVAYTYSVQGRDGQDGKDGKSVSILGEKASTSDLPASASSGDGYLIDGRLYVYDGSDWSDVGEIQGPAGKDGEPGKDGISVSVSAIEYQEGDSATEVPAGDWSGSPVSVGQGQYLWTRTTFSDGSRAYGIARQGADGKSPRAQVSKSGTVSTITIIDADGKVTTAKVNDGEQGTPGDDGKSSYVHVKYSDDGGKTFTGNKGETAGAWLGTYTDGAEVDSADPSVYTWYEIKGNSGADGRGVSQIVEQYYLSTSSASQEGGSWSEAQPAWKDGSYIWTRSAVTWTDGGTSFTVPQLAKALNSANENASGAKSEADENKDALTNLQTQKAIFNLLTDNGKLQGIYMQDGILYLNAEYIKSGAIDASKIAVMNLNADNIKSGTYSVTDSEGKEILRIGGGVENGIAMVSPLDGSLYPASRAIFSQPNPIISDTVASTTASTSDVYDSNGTYTSYGNIRLNGDHSVRLGSFSFYSGSTTSVLLIGTVDATYDPGIIAFYDLGVGGRFQSRLRSVIGVAVNNKTYSQALSETGYSAENISVGGNSIRLVMQTGYINQCLNFAIQITGLSKYTKYAMTIDVHHQIGIAYKSISYPSQLIGRVSMTTKSLRGVVIPI